MTTYCTVCEDPMSDLDQLYWQWSSFAEGTFIDEILTELALTLISLESCS